MSENFVVFNQSTSGIDASSVSFAPTGTIAASDVQAAIVEVDAKAPLNMAIVACSAFDDLPSLGVVERVRFPDAIVLSSVIASVRSDTLVAGASLIVTVSQGANTTTCTIPIGSASVEVAATWTIAAYTDVVFTVDQLATEGKGLKVTLVGA